MFITYAKAFLTPGAN